MTTYSVPDLGSLYTTGCSAVEQVASNEHIDCGPSRALGRVCVWQSLLSAAHTNVVRVMPLITSGQSNLVKDRIATPQNALSRGGCGSPARFVALRVLLDPRPAHAHLQFNRCCPAHPCAQHRDHAACDVGSNRPHLRDEHDAAYDAA